MQEHCKLTDEQFESAIKNCTLGLDVFTHQAHLRFAWLQLDKYEIDKAVPAVKHLLKPYIFSLGQDCKYNETVTIAAVHAVNRFKQKSKTDNFADFINENAELQNNFKEIILSHYKTNVFASALAKEEFIEPDLMPFDSK